MANLTLGISIISGQFERNVAALEEPIASAATRAMDAAAQDVKTEGRASIASAGFSRRWQNTLRVDRYPKGNRESIDAAVFVHHRIQYAGIFEDGGQIIGQPMLWMPLDTTPARVNRQRMTPERFQLEVADLVPMRNKRGVPLLGAQVRLSKAMAAKERPKVPLSKFRNGILGNGVLRTIPLFVGVPAVDMPKKFSIREVCARARDRLPALYVRYFRGN